MELKFCHIDVSERLIFFVNQPLFDRKWQKFQKIFPLRHSSPTMILVMKSMLIFAFMIPERLLYVGNIAKFARMKKKLTLLVDTQLVERMKLLVATNGQSLSAVVEQFFAQQLSRDRFIVEKPEVSDDDVFIAKFGGIASGMGNLTDAEIRDLIYTERMKKHF